MIGLKYKFFEGGKSIKSSMAESKPFVIAKDNAHVELTHDTLDPVYIMNKVKSPQAGAIVLFAGMSYFFLVYHSV